MDGVTRKPFQGVINIIRFNWHFYVIAIGSVLSLILAAGFLSASLYWICIIVAAGIIISTCISLLVSYFAYDQSGLYHFHWLRLFDDLLIQRIANIHAGFDETSAILHSHFAGAQLHVFDFYNPKHHTEISIERARKAYPPFKGTEKISTSTLPLPSDSTDIIFNIFALHEIRNRNERIYFLKQQMKALHQGGKIVVVEHLRDVPNFLAYNIGFFHFLSLQEWKANFQQAALHVEREFKIAHFISVFILSKNNGNTP